MKRELKIEITNLYGSAEFPREITVDNPKLKRTKIQTKRKSDIDITTKKSIEETRSEKSIEQVNSFKWEDKKPVLRLGGAYGKFLGLLKQSGIVLATANADITKTTIRNLIPAVQIIPEWATLELNGEKIHTEKGLVTTFGYKGGRPTQKPTRWDIIPKCTTEITMIYPDAFDDLIKEMMKMAENLNFAERRRGRVKILSGI